MKPESTHRILISRTDSIGDVVLTLPVACALKKRFPDAFIGFLGKAYTQAVIESCADVDAFVESDAFLNGKSAAGWDAIVHVFPVKAIAKKAKAVRIPWRIGTTNRAYHWTTCNKLVRLSRKNSELHESQLNLKLLRPFGMEASPSLPELAGWIRLTKTEVLREEFAALLEPGKFHLILHPKSQGSAREWGLENFAALARLLPAERFQIFVSGTEKEGDLLQPLLKELGDRVTDITGRMSLAQFMAFIRACDGLVAASTGPLHLAAAMGKRAIGIYPPIRPMHAGRWGPVGLKAVALTAAQSCDNCRKAPEQCSCMGSIRPSDVAAALGLH